MTLNQLIYKIEERILLTFVDYMSDEFYLKWNFRHRQGYPLDLKNPKTFNQKLQWLKLYDKHPEYTKLVDKVTSKDYVASVVGEKYIIPTLGVWDTVNEIDWDSLPEQFVVKSTNDSGGVVVCKDKSQFDIEVAKNKLKSLGGRDYTKYNKEYPYRDVSHRFIAEEYIEDESGYELKDYKIFCFDGEPKFLFVATDRQIQVGPTKFDFFDLEWNHLPVKNGHPNNRKRPVKPRNFDEMLEIAGKLSKGFPHVRIDLYNINGVILFGEMTFFHNSGFYPFTPREWDFKFGKYLTLPKD